MKADESKYVWIMVDSSGAINWTFAYPETVEGVLPERLESWLEDFYVNCTAARFKMNEAPMNDKENE